MSALSILQAEGYACQRITFSGSVNIKQIGHAIVHLDDYNEDYLIPLPDVKVSGLISGTPYPEITGTYDIVSSNGFVAEVDFSGKRLLGLSGKKNQFQAGVYRADDTKRKHPIYEIEGAWNDKFRIHDVANKADLGTWNTNEQTPTTLNVAPVNEQDPWESRRAWSGVIDSLDCGDMQGASDAKSMIEQGQRDMRKQEAWQGSSWQPVFFVRQDCDDVFAKLASAAGDQHGEDASQGFWRFNRARAQQAQQPYHGNLHPDHATT